MCTLTAGSGVKSVLDGLASVFCSSLYGIANGISRIDNGMASILGHVLDVIAKTLESMLDTVEDATLFELANFSSGGSGNIASGRSKFEGNATVTDTWVSIDTDATCKK